MKCIECCANCFENVVAIYNCFFFRFSLCKCKYIFVSYQFSAVVTYCIWEPQLLRALEHLSLCSYLPLVKCSGTCWNNLEPKFKVCLVAYFLSVVHELFLQNMMISKCCLFACWFFFFKQLICDGDSLLCTHLTTENLGPWEVSELPRYRAGFDGESE